MNQPAQKSFLGLSPCGFHRVVYQEWGAPNAPLTVVCVHGLTRNARDFDKLAQALSPHARVVAVDVVGRGQSDWLRDPTHYHSAQYCADMNALLAHLQCDNVYWVGTSMGGLLGMMLASQPGTPIRKLVLNDVGPYIAVAALKRIAAYVSMERQFNNFESVLAYFRDNYAQSGPFTDADYEHLARHSTRPLPDGKMALAYDPGIAINFAALVTDTNLWPVYAQITCPTFVVRGALSDVLSSQTASEMALLGPRAKVLTIPGVGHIPGLADDHQITAVLDFLLGD